MEKENIILLIETIERSLSTKPIMENVISVPKVGDFYVDVYSKNEPQDLDRIKRAKEDIMDFFNVGYESKGLGRFMAFDSPKNMVKNMVMLKVGRQKFTGKIISMSIYNHYPSGIKCAGMTKLVTDDPELNKLANASLVHIIREDISHFKDYYWIECDGAIRHWWEKNGGIKIPNTYLPAIFSKNENLLKSIQIEPGEEYEYARLINGSILAKKCIFGFSNKEVLDDYLKQRNTTLDEFIKQKEAEYKVDESISVDTGKIQTDLEILKYFWSEQSTEYLGNHSITEYEMEVFQKSITNIETYLRKYQSMLPVQELNDLVYYLENAYLNANQFSILKPYQFGDEFICEREIYPEDFSYDAHERKYL